MKIINVDNNEYSEKHGMYGGMSGLKDGLIINGEDWLVKYPKNASYLAKHEEMEYTVDPLSEYLGSHIYQILGYPVHETMLVERRGKIAVACKDFIDDSKRQKLLEIRTIKNSANEQLAEILERDFNNTGSSHIVELEELLLHLDHNDILTKIDGVKDRFFDMLIIDIFINNSDRNNGNWGIIREPGKNDTLAPIFDNGGSFNGKTPDSRLKRMLDTKDGIKNNILGSVTVFGKNDKAYSVKKILELPIPEIYESIIRNVPLINEHIKEINDLIDSVPNKVCSDIRKEFYKQSLQIRLEYLLNPIYEQVIEQEREDI